MPQKALAAVAGLCSIAMALSSVSVTIQEWEVPTANSRPHDPAVAPDGSLWYTGQLANKLGRLDENSGEIQEFALDIENSGPHGLVGDSEGNIWFTANSAGYIGKLDPTSGAIEHYFMPDERPATRTRRSSTRTVFCGLPCRWATLLAGWIRPAEKSRFASLPRPRRCRMGLR